MPVAIRAASGAHLEDLDGNRLIDCVLGLGPILLGHNDPRITEAVIAQLRRGVSIAAEHEGEGRLAQMLVDHIPFVEKVTFASTGSEAVAAAVRIARATTARTKILKFDGHYHGWLDPVFVNVPGAMAPVSHPAFGARHAVAGLAASDDVVVVPWNDTDAITEAFSRHAAELAAVIMEPLALNFGVIPPDPGFLETVRRLCDRSGALLLFDEVLSGFRLAHGGAAEILGVEPDLVVYAKALGAGQPIAAVGGTAAAMASIVHGPVKPAGTYSGNPVSVAAGIAMLEVLEERSSGLYRQLEAVGDVVAQGLREVAARRGIPLVVQRAGSVLQLLWSPREPVRCYADAFLSDAEMVARLCEGMLHHGVLAAPRGLLLLSAAHGQAEAEAVIAAFDASCHRLLAAGQGSVA
nr:aminotransferase class III-fold pyridoxal phosphate-dependent enzyme [Phytoactinopolyspora alkaliphila]